MKVEISQVPTLPFEALYPKTLELPPIEDDEKEDQPAKPFEPSPLTGGALTMGPTDFQPVPPSPQNPQTTLKPTYKILLDVNPTPQSAHTMYKTTHRHHYDTSRSRTLTSHQDPPVEEVLLHNPAGEITEGSLTTPYFFRQGKWVTPPVWLDDHGGQRGATRRWALEKHLCVVGAVRVEDVVGGERVWVSNGVRGFGWGYVVKE